ncbi:uncharacterized protein [Ptychodera flava]|uniref:uncharacterized protein isoform X2 n=1 Tax=Ptychodera flava TaxID=63121 RepID=UPI00396A9EA1
MHIMKKIFNTTKMANGIILTVLFLLILPTFVSAAKDLATGALTVTVTGGTIDCSGPVSVTFNLDVCDIGGEGGDITAVKFYYISGDNYEDSVSSASTAHDASLTETVSNGGEHTFTGETVSLTDTSSCDGTWTHVCAVITVTDDAVAENDDSCIILAANTASTNNCLDDSTTPASPEQTSGGTPCSTCTDDPPTESSACVFSLTKYLVVPSLFFALVAVL